MVAFGFCSRVAHLVRQQFRGQRKRMRIIKLRTVFHIFSITVFLLNCLPLRLSAAPWQHSQQGPWMRQKQKWLLQGAHADLTPSDFCPFHTSFGQDFHLAECTQLGLHSITSITYPRQLRQCCRARRDIEALSGSGLDVDTMDLGHSDD